MSAFRILYNQDATNLFATTREPITPAHVDRMVDEVAEAGADVLLINPQAQRTCYPSRVWQTFWDGYAPGHREFFGPVPPDTLPVRTHWIGQMKRLADQGCDYLARALARCRAQALTPGASIRMNDMHDMPWPGSHLFSRFYRDHPEWRLRNPAISGWSATGLNYEHRAVRDHFLTLIREVARYGIEVLELDFLRFSSYFPRRDFAAHGTIMTGFLREVRRVLAATGRKIELIPRVPATPAAAGELGFDVGAWARAGLIDGLTAGGFLQVAWHTAIDEYRSLLKTDVSLYVSTDHVASRTEGLPERTFPLEPDLIRGFAAGAHAAGAGGLELFNFFCPREATPPRTPAFAAIRDARPERFRGAAKAYLLGTGGAMAETDGPHQAPALIPVGQPRAFWLWMAAEPARVDVEVETLFEGAAVPAESLWLHFNRHPVGSARDVRDCSAKGKRLWAARFAVPSRALCDGRNTLVVRTEKAPLTLVALEVRTQSARRRKGRRTRVPRVE